MPLGYPSCQAAWWCCAVHTMVLLGTASFAQGLLADDQGTQILHSANSDALKVFCTAYRPTCVKHTLGAIGWTRCGCGDTGMTAGDLWPIAQYSRRGRLPSIWNPCDRDLMRRLELLLTHAQMRCVQHDVR